MEKNNSFFSTGEKQLIISNRVMLPWDYRTMQLLSTMCLLYFFFSIVKPVTAFPPPPTTALATLQPTNTSRYRSCRPTPPMDTETLAKLYFAISGAMLLLDTRPSEVVLFLGQKWHK